MSSRHTNGNHSPSANKVSVFDRLGSDAVRRIGRRVSNGRNPTLEQEASTERHIAIQIQVDEPSRADRTARRESQQYSQSKEPHLSRSTSDRPPLQRSSYRSANDIPLNSRVDRRHVNGSEERVLHGNMSRISSERLPPQRERRMDSDRRSNDVPHRRPNPPPLRPNDRNYTRHNRPEPYDRPPRNDRLNRRPERHDRMDRPVRRPSRSPQRDHGNDRRPASRPSSRPPSPAKDTEKPKVTAIHHKSDERVGRSGSITPQKEMLTKPRNEEEPATEEKNVPAFTTPAALPYLGENFFQDVDQDVPDYEAPDDEDDFNVVVDAPSTESGVPTATSVDNKNANEQPQSAIERSIHDDDNLKSRDTKPKEDRASLEEVHKRDRHDKKEPEAAASNHNKTTTSISDEPTLPYPWEKYLSKKDKTGTKYYYYNPKTDVSTWDLPTSEDKAQEVQKGHKSKESEKPQSSRKASEEWKRSVEEERESPRSTSHHDESSRSNFDNRQGQGRQSGKDRARDRDYNTSLPAPKRARREANESERREDVSVHFDPRHRLPEADNRPKAPKPLPSQEDLFRKQELDRRPGRPLPFVRAPRPLEPMHRTHSPPPKSRAVDVPIRRARASPPPLPLDRGVGPSRRWSPPPPPRGRRLEENGGRAEDPRRGRDHQHPPYPVTAPGHSERADRFSSRPFDNPNRVPVNMAHSSHPPASNNAFQDRRRSTRENDTREVSGRDEVIFNSRVERGIRIQYGKGKEPDHQFIGRR